MKINLVIPSFYPATIYGGPIFSTLHTCKELSKLDNININVSTTNTNMHNKLDVEVNKKIKFEDNFYVKYYDETKVDKFSLQLFLNVWKDIKKSDIVHIQAIFNTPVPISLLYAKLFNKAIVLSPRGSLGLWCLDNGNRFKSLWLNKLLKPLVKNITWHATATQEKDEILSIYPNAKVTIIPNGIEFDNYQNSNILSSKEYVNKFTNQNFESNKIIISMGRLQKKKGFDILIDSFNIVLKSFPNSVLLIAGSDEGEEKKLKKQIQNLNLEKSIFLIGAISGQDKIDFLANADLFCLPSHNENFGNVYVESLATGTPIVASKMTPWSEVEEYNCGKWVNNNIVETSKAMNEILNQDKNKLKENSKNLASKYDWKNIAAEFKELYESVLEKK
ncbi:glycosyltransferase [Arcobacter sp. YIC-464]|uniref:glycosyltransferase n=1 Tax=Arcobacter sp. YIC-464 TaxID=3376631 RepID=UPI003C1BC5E9